MQVGEDPSADGSGWKTRVWIEAGGEAPSVDEDGKDLSVKVGAEVEEAMVERCGACVVCVGKMERKGRWRSFRGGEGGINVFSAGSPGPLGSVTAGGYVPRQK